MQSYSMPTVDIILYLLFCFLKNYANSTLYTKQLFLIQFHHITAIYDIYIMDRKKTIH